MRGKDILDNGQPQTVSDFNGSVFSRFIIPVPDMGKIFLRYSSTGIG
jgi:hypothetical protein